MCLPVKPFRVEREWVHAGLKCAVVQAREAGHRCGYVRVPPNHPAFQKPYDDVDVNVHGGLTFADLEPCAHEDGQGWWLGFDCAHYNDQRHDPNVDLAKVSPETRKSLEITREIEAKYPISDREWHEHYWTEDEVVAETNQLAEQLALMVA